MGSDGSISLTPLCSPGQFTPPLEPTISSEVRHSPVRFVTALMERRLGTHRCPRMRERGAELPVADPALWMGPPGGGGECEGGGERLMGGEMGDIPDVTVCPLPWIPSHKSAYF